MLPEGKWYTMPSVSVFLHGRDGGSSSVVFEGSMHMVLKRRGTSKHTYLYWRKAILGCTPVCNCFVTVGIPRWCNPSRETNNVGEPLHCAALQRGITMYHQYWGGTCSVHQKLDTWYPTITFWSFVPYIIDLLMKDGDFPVRKLVSLPEGNHVIGFGFCS